MGHVYNNQNGTDSMAASLVEDMIPTGDQVEPVPADTHFNPRGDAIRSCILGATNGLVAVGSTLLGVGGGDLSLHATVLIGSSVLVGGTLAAAFSEYVSVASQHDSEVYDIRREVADHATEEGRQHEVLELRDVYIRWGMSAQTATQAARELSGKEAIRAHIRDELGLNPDRLSNPYQAAALTSITFVGGGVVPFLATIFIQHLVWRLVSCIAASTVGLVASGLAAAHFGGANRIVGCVRTTFLGWGVLGVTYGVGRAIGT